MQPDSELSQRQILYQLRKTDTVLAGKVKTQPLIVYRYGRWHMIGIGFVVDSRMHTRRGIGTVHFMSPYRARKTIAEWLPFSKLTPFEKVCPAFREEFAGKVLSTADDYRPLLQKGRVVLVGGMTTDTLRRIGNDATDVDQLVTFIDRLMQEGPMGPFLHFERTYEVMQG